jgi:hypothetical protein
MVSFCHRATRTRRGSTSKGRRPSTGLIPRRWSATGSSRGTAVIRFGLWMIAPRTCRVIPAAKVLFVTIVTLTSGPLSSSALCSYQVQPLALIYPVAVIILLHPRSPSPTQVQRRSVRRNSTQSAAERADALRVPCSIYPSSWPRSALSRNSPHSVHHHQSLTRHSVSILPSK